MSVTRRPAVPPSRFGHIAGRLCLDFTNTASRLGTDEPIERLLSYDDLVAWALESQLIGRTEAKRLREEAARRPAEADRVLREARRLRGAIWRIFRALSRRERAEPADLETLNRILADGMASRRLHESERGFCWIWEEQPDGLDWPLWPVAYSAAELTTTDELERVKMCEGGACGWLFVDASRNRSRRWCSMEDCGNVIKARRHYARRKQSG
ncbi:MAG TPA: ABATE domain-containing protein [Gemmatimonadales bacterium]|nr:ABATE domain-containing protein [Gemmatimonadales bacterium]